MRLRNRHNRPGLWGSLILTLVLAAWPALATEPTITFDGADVVASGFNSGDTVHWFGLSKSSIGATIQMMRWFDTQTADGGGESRFDTGDEMPWASVWVAVDGATGDFTVAAPDEFPIRHEPMPASGLRTAGSSIDGLELGMFWGSVMVVRPGDSAWVGTASDGAQTDEDGLADGIVELSIDALEAAHRDAGQAASAPNPPSLLASGDLVLAFDQVEMVLFSTVLN